MICVYLICNSQYERNNESLYQSLIWGYYTINMDHEMLDNINGVIGFVDKGEYLKRIFIHPSIFF